MATKTKIDGSAETIEFAAFDASKATDQVRAFAEKGLEQSQETYAKVKANVEEAQKVMEESVETIRDASAEMTRKTIAALRANAEAGFSHIEALFAVKTLSEFVELQTAFGRKQTEAAVEQAKEFQVAATKVAEDVSKPAKVAFEKAMKELKVA
ncbi:MAG: phasin [Notoacmeibacter sp.]|nr:phasin [Notoacmeibacter sp.]